MWPIKGRGKIKGRGQMKRKERGWINEKKREGQRMKGIGEDEWR